MRDQIESAPADRVALVNLTGEPESDWMKQLLSGEDVWKAQPLRSVNDAKVLLDEAQETYAVVVYQRPTFLIAQALDDKMVPTDALISVEEYVSSILELTKQFRSRIVLTEAPSSIRALDTIRTAVQDLTGLAMDQAPDSEWSIGVSSIDPTANPTLILAASQLLGMRRPSDLLEQLEALAVPLDQELWVPSLVSDYMSELEQRKVDADHIRNRESRLVQQVASHEREADRLRDENELVISQLHKLQEDLERYFLKSKNQQEKIVALRRGRDYRKSRIADLQNQLRESHEKIDWLRTARDGDRNRARKLGSESKELQAQVKALTNDVMALQAKIDSIVGSRTWRYTKVLRTLLPKSS